MPFVRFRKNVLAYGLRTDFKGNPFEGASYLMAWADSIRELPSASDLEPYEFATMNMISRNYALTHSDLKNTIQPGFHYIAVSRSMFDRRSVGSANRSGETTAVDAEFAVGGVAIAAGGAEHIHAIAPRAPAQGLRNRISF